MTLPIPEALLPKPRLIIWHGDVETEEEERALRVVARTAHGIVEHGVVSDGELRTTGGSDWTGWHTPNREVIEGLAILVEELSYDFTHWKVIKEL